ncbi:MAG TPA: urease accessory protein UreD [Candidatus Angelobacter sp.]|nr:urease accessory protein UreD [Candidatus Angelobacter sp.]
MRNQCEPVSGRVKASLQLHFEHDLVSRHTVLRECKQEAPLRVVRAFTLEDGAALVHLHNVSGGLLGGDQLEFVIDVGPEASAQLTSTGATRVYRALDHDGDTIQVNRIRVAENGMLEYVPDPLIPFSGARLLQSTSIDLASGAGLFWWDVVAPGREAHNELFAYHRIELRTKVQALRKQIAAERMCVEPRKRNPTSPGRMGTYRYWTTFYICRVGASNKMWLEAEQHLRGVAAGLSQPQSALWGVSTLPAHGLVVRGLTVHGRDAIAGVRVLWQRAKPWLFGKEAILPRKIN